MPRTLCFVLLLTCACGGTAFTAGPDRPALVSLDDAGELPDAQASDGSADAPTPGRDGGERDASDPLDGGAQDAPADGAQGTDAARGDDAPSGEDAGDEACTPLPTTVGQRPYACAPYLSDAGPTALIPANFAWDTNNVTPSACGFAPTPPECQCAATFNCACLRAANVCASLLDGGTWFACNDTGATMPDVTCSQ